MKKFFFLVTARQNICLMTACQDMQILYDDCMTRNIPDGDIQYEGMKRLCKASMKEDDTRR
jgi:hypothetical protein